MKLSLQDATDRIAAVFERRGCSAAVARSVARALVAAEADGLKGHGLSRIPTYLAMLATGKVDGRAVPQMRKTAPGVLGIDAADGYAYPAIDLALDTLPALTHSQGVAIAAIRRSNHCGVAGHHAEALAREGLVALLFANAPAAIAPWGGRAPVFGTNPIAFAAPLEGAEPIVVDLSVSKVARGNILAAKQRNQPIPEGWALDAGGNATTDPAAALAGTMIPFGDAKGAALALMVEILSACLVGANLSAEATNFFDGEGPPPGVGQLIVAFDPAAFGHDGFGARMAMLAQIVLGQEGVRLPGARRVALRRQAQEQGLEIPPEIADAFS